MFSLLVLRNERHRNIEIFKIQSFPTTETLVPRCPTQPGLVDYMKSSISKQLPKINQVQIPEITQNGASDPLQYQTFTNMWNTYANCPPVNANKPPNPHTFHFHYCIYNVYLYQIHKLTCQIHHRTGSFHDFELAAF